MFKGFDFSVLDDPDYKEDAVREDIVAPLLRALGFAPTGTQRMQRSRKLLHPFVMIGSQKRAVHIVPDYTLFNNDEAILVLEAKAPSESIVNSTHVEQAFSYAIHPEVRTKSYALCNGRELVLYDIDRAGPVFRVEIMNVEERWVEVQKHFSPAALLNHHHRLFQPDLGILLRNAGFDRDSDITFPGARLTSLGRTLGGGLTATASPKMVNDTPFAGSFDMPMEVLPALLSCLPEQVVAMVVNALASSRPFVYVGGVIEVAWTARLGEMDAGLHKHDPLIPLLVTTIYNVSRADAFPDVPDDVPASVLNLPTVLQYL